MAHSSQSHMEATLQATQISWAQSQIKTTVAQEEVAKVATTKPSIRSMGVGAHMLRQLARIAIISGRLGCCHPTSSHRRSMDTVERRTRKYQKEKC